MWEYVFKGLTAKLTGYLWNTVIYCVLQEQYNTNKHSFKPLHEAEMQLENNIGFTTSCLFIYTRNKIQQGNWASRKMMILRQSKVHVNTPKVILFLQWHTRKCFTLLQDSNLPTNQNCTFIKERMSIVFPFKVAFNVLKHKRAIK